MTHYETLQVSETASPEVIRAAWAMLQRIYHTDNPHTANPEMCKQVNAAYNVLKDPKKRMEYNVQLAAERTQARRMPDVGINPDAYPVAYIFEEMDLHALAGRAAMAAGNVFLGSILDGMNPAARQLFEQALRGQAAKAKKGKGAA